MKEMNLENLLRSWQPRRPSAGVRSQLFPKQEHKREFVWTIRWLAPTVACGLIALAALREDSPFPSLSSGGHPSAGFIPGEASAIAGVTINRSPDFFEWTNRSGSALNVRSFLPGKTN